LRLGSEKLASSRPERASTPARRALKAWVALRDAKPEDPMFVDEHGNPLTSDHRLAEQLRGHLAAAGVDRRELHHDAKNRRKLRVHDLRATFVTLGLANGKTETWVADRTGHASSQVINRDRRQARAANELGLGELLALHLAIDELCQRQPTREQWQPELVPPEPGTPPQIAPPVGHHGPRMAQIWWVERDSNPRPMD
jgi:integrase